MTAPVFASPELAAATTELYTVFGDGPLARQIHGCPCCSDPETLARWSRTPLRDLPAEELEAYVYSAMSTIGDEEDFKHFTPRLLALAAEDPDGVDVELVAAHLARAHWSNWLPQQRGAVDSYLDAIWRALLVREHDSRHIDAVVCGLALAGKDISKLLTEWAASAVPPARTNLRRFIELNLPILRKKQRLSNAFWDESPSKEVEVADWLRAFARAEPQAR